MSWIERLKDKGDWAPFWLGFFIATSYLLIHCMFDAFFLVTWGFPQGTDPLWRRDGWWTDIVNATLLGYIPAVTLIAYRGIESDFSQFRPLLQGSETEVDDIRTAATGSAGFVGKAFMLSGILLGLMAVHLDPSLSHGTEHAITNPVFLWPQLHLPIFTWLVFGLIVSDIKATYTYLHLGRNLIEIDLLDLQSLSPFARRGLRSALTWVIFSMIFSLFWIDDRASTANPVMFVGVLMMATGAFIVPLIGVHNNILSVKGLELDRLRNEIRIEREVVNKQLSGDGDGSPRLANLAAYYQLIGQAREWPINGANLLRFFMYMLIGLGSWLGGAMVERLLDRTLGA